MKQELQPESVLAARLSAHAEAGLRRVSLEVSGEQVSIFLRGGRVRVLCTCGAEGCEHANAAFGFLGEAVPAGVREPRVLTSLRPPPPSQATEHVPVAEALEALCLAIVRAGVASPDSPSIREALDQLIARAGTPIPLGVARWVARLNDALSGGDVGKVARVLDGARELADELKRGEWSASLATRRRAWLGAAEATASSDALTETTLVEVARERLSGLTRAAIERRYLVDLTTGEAFREERRRGEQDISVGPCPRVVHVAFGQVESGAWPRRVRLLQYTIGARPLEAHFRKLEEHAVTRVSELASRYREAARSAQGLSEPFVLFAPKELEGSRELHLRDAAGERIALGDEAGTPLSEAVRAVSAGNDIAWVSGRLVGVARGLVLRPTSVLLRREHTPHLCRIT